MSEPREEGVREERLQIELTRGELAALHFHYTKNGIPKEQVAARQLATKLAKVLKGDV